MENLPGKTGNLKSASTFLLMGKCFIMQCPESKCHCYFVPRIFIYNAVDSTRRYVMSVKLPDAVLAIK